MDERLRAPALHMSSRQVVPAEQVDSLRLKVQRRPKHALAW